MKVLRDLGSYRGPDFLDLQVGEDPMADPAVMKEGYLLGLEHDIIRSRLLLLADCRHILNLDAPNTAMLVVNGVTELTWTQEVFESERVQHTIGSWHRKIAATGEWELSVGMMFGEAALYVRGASARFFYVDVPGCDAAPPDFGEAGEAEMARGLAGWESEFELVQVTSYPPWPATRPAKYGP